MRTLSLAHLSEAQHSTYLSTAIARYRAEAERALALAQEATTHGNRALARGLLDEAAAFPGDGPGPCRAICRPLRRITMNSELNPLPAPWEAVSVGCIHALEDRIYIDYHGRPEDLVACGAMEPEMLTLGRKGVRRRDSAGDNFTVIKRGMRWSITRIPTTLQRARQLPGVPSDIAFWEEPPAGGGTGQTQRRERRPLPRLAAALQRRYPQIRIHECSGIFDQGRLVSQNVYFRGSLERLIASGLVTEETVDKLERHQLDSRHPCPASEYGDMISLCGVVNSPDMDLSLYVDEVADGPEIRDGVLRIDSQKLQRQIAGLLKKAFALPRREISP